MKQLETFPPSASTDELLAAINRDGAAILDGQLSEADRKQFRDELDPYMDATENGASLNAAVSDHSNPPNGIACRPIGLPKSGDVPAPVVQLV